MIAKNNKLKFKFVFDDASVSLQDADNFNEAAILVISNRIRSSKTKKLVGAWVNTEGKWEHVIQKTVSIMTVA